MSRYNHRHAIKPLLKAAEHWKQRCLNADGGLLTDGDYWSSACLAELDERFIQNPLEGEESFIDKLQLQLADASPAAIKLMAELNWLLLLFSTNIKPATKRDLVRTIWEINGDTLPSSWLLDDDTLSGAGSTGTGFNTLRWRELVFLIEVLKAFKGRNQDQQQPLLQSPWAFADWLDSIPGAQTRQFRHILCFLLYPDSFEHTSVGRDKKAILQAMAGLPTIPRRTFFLRLRSTPTQEVQLTTKTSELFSR